MINEGGESSSSRMQVATSSQRSQTNVNVTRIGQCEIRSIPDPESDMIGNYELYAWYISVQRSILFAKLSRSVLV